jgi:hypothetical protein
LREGAARETGVILAMGTATEWATAFTALTDKTTGEGERTGTETDNDNEPEGRPTFVAGPGITAEIAADAPTAEELCAATAPAFIFTWAKADNGSRANHRAARIGRFRFTITEYPPFHLGT